MAPWLARFRSDPRLRWAAIGVGVSLLLALLTVSATAEPDSLVGLTAQMFAKTALVLGLMFLALAGLKRWQVSGAQTRQLAIVETLRLSPRQALHLVRVGERVLLVGASDTQVSLLTEMDEAAVTETTPDSFTGVLEQLRMHVSRAPMTSAHD